MVLFVETLANAKNCRLNATTLTSTKKKERRPLRRFSVGTSMPLRAKSIRRKVNIKEAATAKTLVARRTTVSATRMV